MKNTKGFIIIKHSILRDISDQECIDALNPEELKLSRKFINVQPASVRLSETKEANYRQIASEQSQIFNHVVLPLIKENIDYEVLYFGLAPIPLAIDLGSKFSNLYPVSIYQYHHTENIWYQDTEVKSISNFAIESINLPTKITKGVENVVLRVSTSLIIDPEDTNAVFDNAFEVDIKLEETHRDAFSTSEDFNKFILEVDKALNSLTQNFSKVKEIHLFAAIPAGLAFAIGNLLNPTIHPKLQTYNFNSKDFPKYKKGLLIGENYEDETLILTNEDIEKCNNLRAIGNELLASNIRTFLLNQKDNTNSKLSWYENINKNAKWKAVNKSDFWLDLPSIFQTSLILDEINLVETTGFEGFTYRENKWLIDNNFFYALEKRLKSEDKIKQALRLFLFHEALHYKKHKLTTFTVEGIGNFPKVLEITDYQADVYAILNNYQFEMHYNSAHLKPKEYFLNSIDTAMETMWSFDDRGKELKEIQVRRVSRYLMWYWQYAAIQAVENESFESIVSILFNKPVIEINGLKMYERNNRIVYDLSEFVGLLEIAIFRNNEVVRDGAASNLKLRDLIQGFKTMNSDIIKSVMKSFYDR